VKEPSYKPEATETLSTEKRDLLAADTTKLTHEQFFTMILLLYSLAFGEDVLLDSAVVSMRTYLPFGLKGITAQKLKSTEAEAKRQAKLQTQQRLIEEARKARVSKAESQTQLIRAATLLKDFVRQRRSNPNENQRTITVIDLTSRNINENTLKQLVTYDDAEVRDLAFKLLPVFKGKSIKVAYQPPVTPMEQMEEI